MKKFRVDLYYQEIGSIEIKAKTANAAKKKVTKILEKDGIDNMELNVVDRDYGVLDVHPLSDSLFKEN